MAAAEFICKIIVNRLDAAFQELAASGATLADFLRTPIGDGEESSSLPAAYAAFNKTLQSAPVSSTIVDTGEVYDIIPGDEESEERSKLLNQIIGKRRERCAFHYPPVNSNDIFRKGGPLTLIFQNSKFIEAKADSAGKSNTILLMSADLFPNKASLCFHEVIKNRFLVFL